MAYQQHVADAQGLVARCAIITLSDTRTPDTDTSGQTIRKLLENDGHQVASYRLILDDSDQLRGVLDELLPDDSVDVVLTTGGTGISARDTTFEAITQLFEKRLDGFGELFRMISFNEIGSAAMMSRATAGTVGRKAIFVLPGSPAAVRLAMEKLIVPELGHVIQQLSK